MTYDRAHLAASWQSWIMQDEGRVGPEWLHLVWTQLFCMVVAAGFTILGFALYASGNGAWRNLSGWVHWYGVNLVVAMCVGFTIHALFRIITPLVGAQRIRRFSMLKRTFFYTAIPMVGVAIGWPLSSWLLAGDGAGWLRFADANTIAASLGLSLLISFVFHQYFSVKARQIDAERRATEAQLRLLQGQIEPHFLFNTLAGVISLIDHDAAKAKQTLQAFTDYLRSSLGNLRRDASPLAQELELAENYLLLLQARMEDRLRFTIDASPEARAVVIPPLLLQPLIENAVVHGLEPSVAGGQVQVRATIRGTHLVIEVDDDGRGLDAPPVRRNQPGAGMAVANVRERLRSRYGDAASLRLEARQPGTRATLTVPTQATAP